MGSYFVRRAHNNFLRPRHKVCPKPWLMYPKAWFTYPKAWFIYPKPWDKLCAGVTPTFSGENVILFCRRRKVKILVGLKRCPVGHNGRSARPFSQDGVCVSPWGAALPPPPRDALLTFLWGRPTAHRLRLCAPCPYFDILDNWWFYFNVSSTKYTLE